VANIGRSIYRQIERSARQQSVYGQMQAEAAARPESRQVRTSWGDVWMSPIEVQLYEALVRKQLAPISQYRIQGYYVDFAFPDVALAVEADGAAFHSGERHASDRKRDWILRRAGWTVQRFHGTTIYHKADNCAFVVKREIERRRAWAVERARQEELRRQARRDAMVRPFRALARWLGFGKREGP